MTAAGTLTRRERLLEMDRASLWHPFTPQSVYAAEGPLVIERGEGHELVDVDGRRYLDAVGSIWCNTLGHRHEGIDRAIRDQLGRIAHATLLGNASVPAIELAHRLARLAPDPLTKVFFSDNGSTAVEIAVKMALQYWQQVAGGARRRRFVAFGEAYHGDTVGAVSVGGIDLFHRRFGPLLFETLRVPSPGAVAASARAAEAGRPPEAALAALLEARGDEVAAVVLEPGFQGAGGFLVQPAGFAARVAELSRRAGALVIFDEVASGMGRSGRLFACEHEEVVPDFVCIAKGLTGGYLPLAATLTTDAVYGAFLGPPAEGRTFFHGHTYTGNALGAAAALAVLDVFEQSGFLEGLQGRIRRFAGLVRGLSGAPFVREVRTWGLAAGVELAADPENGVPFPPAERMGMRICGRVRERGVFMRPIGDVLILMPPLTLTEAEMETVVDAVRRALEREADERR